MTLKFFFQCSWIPCNEVKHTGTKLEIVSSATGDVPEEWSLANHIPVESVFQQLPVFPALRYMFRNDLHIQAVYIPVCS
jgi:hypothetical protein